MDPEQIALIRRNCMTRIAEITASPKPSYKEGDREFKWSEYLAQLQSTIAWCNEQETIAVPFEVLSQGYT